MATEKLTTGEILALARRQGAFGGGGGSAAAGPAEPVPDESPASSAPEPEAAQPPPKPRAATPSSTADILAAARGQGASAAGAGGAEKPKPAASKAAASPRSTADILAAARSQGGGAAKGGPAVKADSAPAGGTPAAKSSAASAPAGDHPSVQEMLRAMHEQPPSAPAAGSAAAPAAGPTPVARPALPGKPPLPKKKEQSVSRRAALSGALAAGLAILLTPFALGWALMAVIGGLWSLLGARFMMPNMVVELPSKFKVGPPSDFPPGAVSEKFKASRGIWIVNTSAYNGEQEIFALYSVCTHLGCTPNWLEGEQKFKCPCHGSGFYISGINFEGPAPRPLERAGIKLAEDGSLEVDKSVKFQEELGQWQDGKSFFQV